MVKTRVICLIDGFSLVRVKSNLTASSLHFPLSSTSNALPFLHAAVDRWIATNASMRLPWRCSFSQVPSIAVGRRAPCVNGCVCVFHCPLAFFPDSYTNPAISPPSRCETPANVGCEDCRHLDQCLRQAGCSSPNSRKSKIIGTYIFRLLAFIHHYNSLFSIPTQIPTRSNALIGIAAGSGGRQVIALAS
jgi:hypothetical protein